MDILRQAIKQAVLRKTNDATAYPQAQVEYKERPSTTLLMSPYGICARAPDGSFALTLDCECDPSVQITIAADIARRFKNLAEGEVVVFNTLTPGSYVHLKSNGDVDIAAESGTINLLDDVVIAGELQVAGEVTVDLDVTQSITGVTAFTHLHSDPQGGNTGPPI